MVQIPSVSDLKVRQSLFGAYRKDLSELRKIHNAVWERDVVSRKNEMAILRRTERAMMRAMCGIKIIEKRRSQELMNLLGLKDTLDGLARASGA